MSKCAKIKRGSGPARPASKCGFSRRGIYSRGVFVGKLVSSFFMFILAAAPAWAQQRPLRTDDAELLELGRIRAEFGMEFLQNQRFSLSGLEGDLSRLGVMGIQVGVGQYAEFQISGVLQDYLSISKRSAALRPPDAQGTSTQDFGDIVLATKLKLASEKGMRPALAFKFGVQLPNSSQTKGLGTDETQFYSGILAAKSIGRARLMGNLGLAILGNPVGAGQADLLTYGAGIIVPLNPRLNLVGEINGREATAQEKIGNESQGQARFGIQLRAAGLRWEAAGLAGLRSLDPDHGVVFGIAYEFKAFQK
jgi:hypothetical protein